MKKILAILLALTMVIGTGIMVSAQEDLTDVTSITFVKKLEAQGKNPAETFNFTIGSGSVKEGSASSAPAFNPNTFTISVAEGANQGTKIVSLPTFDHVGRYEYPIEEVAGNTAGMIYDTASRTLVVLVINNPNGEGLIRIVGMKGEDGKKTDDFTVSNNSFDSGSLELEKVITGNLADPNDEFKVTVTLTVAEGKTLKAEAIEAQGGTLTNNEDGTITILYTVKGGDKFTVANIPYDVSYVVEETDALDYIVSYNNEAGEMNAEEAKTTITNNRDTDIETGISLDNLPYIMTMVLALGGLVLYVVRKRRLN